jgi:hypothetical protein
MISAIVAHMRLAGDSTDFKIVKKRILILLLKSQGCCHAR